MTRTLPVKIDDLTVRDGQQSLIATRMAKEDILNIVAALDKVGFGALEVWGGATFDSAMRFLKESPWEMLRAIKKAAPNTPLMMLLRGQNIVGYKHYSNDTLERFIRLTIENGIDIIRCFDALNDPNNVKNAFRFIKKHGGTVEAAVAYTMSPVHDKDYYVELVKTYEDLGADCFAIKDMAGILLPEDTYELVSALKEATDKPVTLHSHTTAGATHLVMIEALKAGIDKIEGCLAPFSGGTAHLADETLYRTAEVMGRPSGLDTEAMEEASKIANDVVDKYIANGLLKTKALIPNPRILTYQVPGGMLSNLMNQLDQSNALDKLDAVLEEVPRVREDLGYPPLVTPLSQMVGTQAVFNVLLGERYKIIPTEIKEYLIGNYGKAPGEVKTEMFREVIDTYEPKEEDKEPDHETAKRLLSEAIGREATEEEVIAYILFPNQTVDLLRPAEPEPEVAQGPVAFNLYLEA